ncbi:transposase family protein [Enemella dayhoffiae]|uniref:transposase family protein n=1 Tax=Enemella dayhoffiae TaxID=2016507 RepID=UPI003898EFC3
MWEHRREGEAVSEFDRQIGDVEIIDAPWAGRPVRIRWRKRRWICLEDVCAVVSFVEQNPQVCAPRGLLSTRAIRWAIG